jgi:hypothetical protein
VRWLSDPPALRAAPGFYTDASDLDRLEAALRAMLAGRDRRGARQRRRAAGPPADPLIRSER